MTDPWLPPPSQPYAAPSGPPYTAASAPPYPAPPAMPYPAQPFPAPVPQPAARRGPSKTAVAALVVACVALTGVVGMSLSFLAPMLMFGGMDLEGMGMDGTGGEYELMGTLPVADPIADYPDELLVAEVERVLDNDWSTYGEITCEPLGSPAEGATTSCSGEVDGMETDIGIEVEDELGHFTLTESW